MKVEALMALCPPVPTSKQPPMGNEASAPPPRPEQSDSSRRAADAEKRAAQAEKRAHQAEQRARDAEDHEERWKRKHHRLLGAAQQKLRAAYATIEKERTCCKQYDFLVSTAPGTARRAIH